MFFDRSTLKFTVLLRIHLLHGCTPPGPHTCVCNTLLINRYVFFRIHYLYGIVKVCTWVHMPAFSKILSLQLWVLLRTHFLHVDTQGPQYVYQSKHVWIEGIFSSDFICCMYVSFLKNMPLDKNIFTIFVNLQLLKIEN